jgi:hypothetical protein
VLQQDLSVTELIDCVVSPTAFSAETASVNIPAANGRLSASGVWFRDAVGRRSRLLLLNQ